MLLLAAGYVALFAFYGGVGLFLQSKIAAIDPARKALAFAAVAGLIAVCSTVVNPTAGLLSDRTQSRFGRRVPWLMAGSSAAFASAVLLASIHTVLAIGLVACLAFSAVNLYQAALAPIVPDQVPRSHRGRASAVIGVASAAGWIAGTQVIAQWPTGAIGLACLGGGLLAVAVLLAAYLRESQQTTRTTAPQLHETRLSQYTAAFRSRDFARVFAGRALMMFSYDLILVYLLYILEDYVHRPEGISAPRAVATVVAVSGGSAAITAFAAGALADSLKKYRPFVLVAGLAGGSALMIPLITRNWTAFVVFAAVQGVAIGVYYAVDTALATLVLPDDRATARDLGLLNIATSAPPVVAPLVAAVAVEVSGYEALFPLAAVGALLSATSIMTVKSVA